MFHAIIFNIISFAIGGALGHYLKGKMVAEIHKLTATTPAAKV